jgi:hypothetical protein
MEIELWGANAEKTARREAGWREFETAAIVVQSRVRADAGRAQYSAVR